MSNSLGFFDNKDVSDIVLYLTVLLFLFQCFDFFCCHSNGHAHREPDLVHACNVRLLDLLTYISYKISCHAVIKQILYRYM